MSQLALLIYIRIQIVANRYEFDESSHMNSKHKAFFNFKRIMWMIHQIQILTQSEREIIVSMIHRFVVNNIAFVSIGNIVMKLEPKQNSIRTALLKHTLFKKSFYHLFFFVKIPK